MFKRIQAAVARSEAHGHQTMNDYQALAKFLTEIIKAGAEDLTEVVEEAKTTLKEARDGVTIKTKIEVDWVILMGIAAAIKQGITPAVNSLPLTLVNRIVLEEKGEK